MRLWHKTLISVLPREQLIGSWRELSAIAGNIITKGTPNHILVNKILHYNYDHFITYALYVRNEMKRRGYKTSETVWNKIVSLKPDWQQVDFDELYREWHTDRYLCQCYYNLEEKFDCGGISAEDYQAILIECNENLTSSKMEIF